jgi:vancomycin permeability regulator SanA
VAQDSETESATTESATTESAATESATEAQSGRRRRLPRPAAFTRRRLRLAYQVLAVGTVLFFLPVTAVRAEGDGYIRSVADVPVEPVGIVLGAEVVGDAPSAYLASRLDTALALWHAHKIKVFLVSGDNSTPDYNEPKAMRDYLVAKGVPADLVVLDYAGFDTWQSCTRAKRIFGVSRAIVISQTFHLPRAAYLCRAAGIETYAVGDADAAWTLSPDEDVNDHAREVLAGFYAVYQATFTPDPALLGRTENGVATALRAAG